MALPTTISALAFPVNSSGNLGPYLYGSNVYVVADKAALGRGVEVHKATDPTSSFSEQDASNAPDLGTSQAMRAMDSYFDGTYIHVAFTGNSYNYYYCKFDCSTDTWLDVDSVGGTQTYYEVYNPPFNPTVEWVSITVRSDGDVIILHPGSAPKVMGESVNDVSYSRLEGTPTAGTWTTGVVVADTNSKGQNYRYGYAVMNDGDQAHFGYMRSDQANFYLRCLNSSNTLRTQRSVALTNTGDTERVRGAVSFTRSSTDKIAFEIQVWTL